LFDAISKEYPAKPHINNVHRTACPRFKPELTEDEFRDIYTPTAAERAFAQRHRSQRLFRLALLVPIKTTQRFGYIVKLTDVPLPVLSHIAEHVRVNNIQKQNMIRLAPGNHYLIWCVSRQALNPLLRMVKNSL